MSSRSRDAKQTQRVPSGQPKPETKEEKTIVLDVPSKLLLNIVDRIISFEQDNPELGRAAAQVVLFLLTKGEAFPEEKIAAKLNLDVGEVRKILQILYRYSLVELLREAVDVERGRYENRWRVSRDLVVRVLKSRLRNVIDVIQVCLNEYTNTAYYVCPCCFKRYSMDDAYNVDFRCPRDDTPLVQPDTAAEVEFLARLIKDLQDYLEKLGSETKHA